MINTIYSFGNDTIIETQPLKKYFLPFWTEEDQCIYYSDKQVIMEEKAILFAINKLHLDLSQIIQNLLYLSQHTFNLKPQEIKPHLWKKETIFRYKIYCPNIIYSLLKDEKYNIKRNKVGYFVKKPFIPHDYILIAGA